MSELQPGDLLRGRYSKIYLYFYLVIEVKMWEDHHCIAFIRSSQESICFIDFLHDEDIEFCWNYVQKAPAILQVSKLT